MAQRLQYSLYGVSDRGTTSGESTMKTKVLIIEDNYYRFFTTKQILQSQLKLDITVIDAKSGREFVQSTTDMKPDMIMFSPEGGVAELLLRMKKRHTNRRNTEVVLMVLDEHSDEFARKVKEFVKAYPKDGMGDAA